MRSPGNEDTVGAKSWRRFSRLAGGMSSVASRVWNVYQMFLTQNIVGV